MAGRANDAQELPLAPMPALETLALKLQAGETDERWRGAWAWMGQDHTYRARAASLIEAMGGKMIRTIGQARADFALTLMAACYNIRRTVWLVKSNAIPW